MKESDYRGDSADSAVDARARTVVSRTLKEHIPDRPDKFDREKCLADAAEKIVGALKAESLFATAAAPARDIGEAAGISNFGDIVKRVSDGVRQGYLSSNLQMMMALGSAIAERDTGSAEHNYKVTLYSAMLGEEIGLNQRQIQTLVKGSFLHDIGKVGIPDRILLKSEKLSGFEAVTMQNHVLVGAHIIKDVKWLEDAQEVVLFHHERWDGSGYLAKLKGTKIPVNARIFAIVDVFDALTSDRPYKPAMSFSQAIRYLTGRIDTHFDPQLMKCFVRISRDLLQDIADKDLSELPGLVEEMLNRHFEIDLRDENLKSKYHIM